MTTNVISMRGAQPAPKATRSKMETMLLNPEVVGQWKSPPFQRPLRVNAKVMAIAEELKNNLGFIEGVISLGTIGDDHKTYYLWDGQHRIEAAKISGLPEFIADVRVSHFETLAEMGIAFVNQNTAISRMRPDDVLRGMEMSLPSLRLIRKHCPFVGYDNIRRNPSSPTLSLSAAIRCWIGSEGETPALTASGKSAAVLAMEMTQDQTEGLIQFLNVAREAWGGDLEYGRLWSNLNMTLCMWLWRQIVINRDRGVKRVVVLSAAQFKRGLMSLSASPDYIDYLLGRQLNERDRSPCFLRIKSAFVARLKQEGLTNVKMPAPSWASR